MPIMSGFEACKKIDALTEDNSKNMFKVNKGESSHKSSSSQELIEFAWELKNRPIMVAYSGLVNQDVRQQCEKAGFQLVIENPLTTQKIVDMIIPLLE